MSLVPSLLQAIVKVDGEALVMHPGDRPYVVSPSGQVELASRGLTLEAVNGIVGQLLPAEIQSALEEFGAIQYELPARPEFPGELFTIVAARGGDDVWIEVRRRRPVTDLEVPEEFLSPPPMPDVEAPAPVAAARPQVAMQDVAPPPGVLQTARRVEPAVAAAPAEAVHAHAGRAASTKTADDDLMLPDAAQLWPARHDEWQIRDASRTSEEDEIDIDIDADIEDDVEPEPDVAVVAAPASSVPQQPIASVATIGDRTPAAVPYEAALAELPSIEAAAPTQAVAAIESHPEPTPYVAPPSEAAPVPPRPEAVASAALPAEPIASVEASAEPNASTEMQGEPIAAVEVAHEPIASIEMPAEPIAAAEAPHEPIASVEMAAEPIAAVEVPREPIASIEMLAEPIAAAEVPHEPIAAVEVPHEPIATVDVRPEPAAPPQPAAIVAPAVPPAPHVEPIAYVAEPAPSAVVVPPPPAPIESIEAPREAMSAAAPEPIACVEMPSELMASPPPAAVAEAVEPVALPVEPPAPVAEAPSPIPVAPPSAPIVSIEAWREPTPPPAALVAPVASVVPLSEPIAAPPAAAATVPAEPVATPAALVAPPEPIAPLIEPVASATPSSVSTAAMQMPSEAPPESIVSIELEATPMAPVARPAAAVVAQPAPAAPQVEARAPETPPAAAPVRKPIVSPAPIAATTTEPRAPVQPSPEPVAVSHAPRTVPTPPPMVAEWPPSGHDTAPPASRVAPPVERADVPPPAVVLPISRSPIRPDHSLPLVTGQTLPGLERLLRLSSARGASTLYLSSESRPSVRVDGELQMLDGEPVLAARDVESLLLSLMPERSHEALRTGALTEWICDIEGVGRIRCMSFRDHRGPGGVFRLMPTRVVSVEQLAVPRHVQSLAIEPEGLVLVAGPRSSGKRTLMAAFVDLMNRTRRDHIITIEREINVVHERGHSFISQREVRGNDDEMLAAARGALREDPDVLVIEELRTGALMNVALEAVASGRLVIGGFAAHTAAGAIDRIIDLYAPEYRRQVQFALADSLRGVIVQVLLRKIGGGRLPAREVLLNTPAVSSVIAEGKTSQLPMAIEGGRRYGMLPLNDALVALVQSGAVDAREAYRQSPDRPGFLAGLNRQGIDTSFVERLA